VVSVVGAEEVEGAAAAGVLPVGARDIVTPLARERARELGVQLVVATPGTAAAVVGDRLAARSGSVACTNTAGDRSTPSPLFDAAPPLPMPPIGALFRRGAPLPAGMRGAGGFTGRVVVVGAGNVGTITAMRLADADVFTEIVLVDVDEGRAQGVALDLTHAAALVGFATRVRGTGVVADAGPADYVVITAGRARQPGMSRSDLVNTNATIVGEVAEQVAKTCPDAVILVVTNPLDEMTQHAWRASGFPSHRVLGMAGVLDTARFQALTALTGVDRADRIAAAALGSHGAEMVIPLSQASAGGQPLALDPATLDALVARTRESGAEVVGLLRSGSAFVAPGAAAARMVLAMAADSDEVMTAAVLADGKYGIRDVYVGLPVRLGRHGLREIVQLNLQPDELAALRAAADRIRDRVGALTS
jgi:malate dehydrogenase